MQPKLTVKTVLDGSVKATKNFKSLSRLAVYVGIPEKNASRKGGKANNAQILFFNTNGVRTSDVRRRVGAAMNRGLSYDAATALYLRSAGSIAYAIPPRPVIEPAIELPDNKAAIVVELKGAASNQLSGNDAEAITGMKRAGTEATNRVKAFFYDPRNNWPPNSPATIKRKGSSRPLISSGKMRDAIIWVLANKS